MTLLAAYICFQKITLHRSNFSDGYISHTAMSSSCTAFYGQMRHVICVIVIHNFHLAKDMFRYRQTLASHLG